MTWVLKPTGICYEISSGAVSVIKERFKESLENVEIVVSKVHLSTLSTVINVLWSNLKDKPLKDSLKNPDLLWLAFLEAQVDS